MNPRELHNATIAKFVSDTSGLAQEVEVNGTSIKAILSGIRNEPQQGYPSEFTFLETCTLIASPADLQTRRGSRLEVNGNLWNVDQVQRSPATLTITLVRPSG